MKVELDSAGQDGIRLQPFVYTVINSKEFLSIIRP